tara:strand:- start:1266 stop:1622 length:357 start_codon:yes stop_codon:yes gene_type:complete
MITLQNASKIASSKIEEILEELKMKYDIIEYNISKSKENFHIKCSSNKKNSNIVIRFIPDNQRRTIKKINIINRDAWKCEVYSIPKIGSKLERGICMNENNFSKESIEKLFMEYLIKD